MREATQEASQAATPTADPSMAQLAPRPSRFRKRLMVLAAVGVLAAAVLSPNVLRPSVSQSNSGSSGSWIGLPSQLQVMTTTSMTAQTWPHVDIESIEDLPGVQLVGAWIIDESVLEGFDTTIDETSYKSGLSYIEAALPGFDTERNALPQALGRNESAVLVALWDIESCDNLDAISGVPARLELRTIFHTSSTETLPDIASPGFDVDAFRRTGVCA